MIISLIAAVAENNVIGSKNKLPWNLPNDLKRFKKLTLDHHILMGLKTFESIGKPLPGRVNIVLSDKKGQKIKSCIVVNSLKDGFEYAKKNDEKELFIIGGASVYKQTINRAQKLYITHIHHSFEGDTYFPTIDKSIWQKEKNTTKTPNKNNPYKLDFVIYKRR